MIGNVGMNNVGFQGLFRVPIPQGNAGGQKFVAVFGLLNSIDPEGNKTSGYCENTPALGAEHCYYKIITTNDLDPEMRNGLARLKISDYEEKPFDPEQVDIYMAHREFNDRWEGREPGVL